MRANQSLAGKVAIITGAASGIGEATARAFAKAGAAVVLAARRADRLERLAGEIQAMGGRALALSTDVNDPQQISALVQRTVSEFGRIDVLANIAGWGRYKWYEQLTAEELRRQFEVNVLGLAELTRQVVPVMQRQRSGHILNMASFASRIAWPPLTVYASTKYAVEGLSDGLRRELAPWGIHVTRIHPGGVTGTEYNAQAAEAGGIQYRSIPIGRVTKEKVAEDLVRLIERPRRELFLGTGYGFLVFLNRRLPWLVDAIARLWVSQKRRDELSVGAMAAPRPGLLQTVGLGLAGLMWALILGSLLPRRVAPASGRSARPSRKLGRR